MIGTILNNRYELLEKIGEGGMAEVYKARCNKLNRFDAVKILKAESLNDPVIVEKFKREATAIANLSDSNIVNIFDVGTQDNIHYIVMEYVKGKTLKEIIVENVRLSHERAIEFGIQIAKALECAHRNNIIHRDIKPQNILVNENSLLKVTDFGIAKASSSATITNSNKVIGSAHYFSPEQAKGIFVDCRTDIYSLGIVLYEMVTGKVPFDADSPVALAIKHIQEKPIPPIEINKNIPLSLNNLILKAIEKDPNNRYQTVRDIMTDLKRLQMDINAKIDTNDVERDRTRVMEAVSGSTQVMDAVNPDVDKTMNINNSQRFNELINSNTNKRNINHNQQQNDYDDEEEYNHPSKTKNKSKKKLIFVLLCVLVVVLGAVVAIYKQTSSGAKDPATNAVTKISVPNVVGKSQEDAKNELEKAKLVASLQQQTSDEVEAGNVISTSPQANTNVDENSTVIVMISSGAEKVKVPDLSGLTKDKAQAALEKAGLKLGSSTTSNSSTVAEGTVIESSPSVDTEIAKGQSVDITISAGKKVTLASVPNLTGMTIDEAKKSLSNKGLVLDESNVTQGQTTTDPTKVGTIYEQNPDPNTSVAQNTKVRVSVYAGDASTTQVTIPNFIGENFKQVLNDPLVKNGKIKLTYASVLGKVQGDFRLTKIKVTGMKDSNGKALQNGDSINVGDIITLITDHDNMTDPNADTQ